MISVGLLAETCRASYKPELTVVFDGANVMSIAGVVRYQFQPDGSLDGRWTHSDLGGRIAAERASGGTPGQLSGRYAVEIHAADGEKLYQGELAIQPFAESYTLTWSGYLLLPVREPATFSGIGMLVGKVLISTFQKDAAPSAAGQV